jgi:hypothetical protein
MTMMTVIKRPIWPAIWPYQALSAVRTTASRMPAGAVPSRTLAPPTTTVTNDSMMKVTPMVGISVIVGAYSAPHNPASAAPMPKLIAYMRSVLTPRAFAISAFCIVARAMTP